MSLLSSADVFLSALVFFSPSLFSGFSVFTAAFLGAMGGWGGEETNKTEGEQGAGVGAEQYFAVFPN